MTENTLCCHFCRNRSAWLWPATGWRLCTSCRSGAIVDDWDELARRWLRTYPEEWIGDVAAYIEVNADRGGAIEPTVALAICEGGAGCRCLETHA
jgi:hypothetical protein